MSPASFWENSRWKTLSVSESANDLISIVENPLCRHNQLHNLPHVKQLEAARSRRTSDTRIVIAERFDTRPSSQKGLIFPRVTRAMRPSFRCLWRKSFVYFFSRGLVRPIFDSRPSTEMHRSSSPIIAAA